ncbi:MAG: TonB-dependent receptor plug domain-containing protein [Rhodothalassiaceae bacterium]
MWKSLFSTVSCLTLATALPVLAQTPVDDARVEELIVTGTRIPVPLAQAGRAVSLIGFEEIVARQQRFVLDALRISPGVQVSQNGSFGGVSSVSIRGAGSGQTLVVFDGIVLNDPSSPSSAFDFASLDTNDIERIEVLRGPQSVLYGSDALGGVINIVTRAGKPGIAARVFVEGGSFGTARGSASVRGGTERLNGRLTLSGVGTDGFSAADEADGNTEDDGFRNINLTAKGRYEPLDWLTLDAVARFSDSDNEFDGFDQVTFEFGDTEEEGNDRELSFAGFATGRFLDDRLTQRLSIAFSQTQRLDTTVVGEGKAADRAETFDGDGDRLSVEYRGTYEAADWLTVAFGAEHEEIDFVSESDLFGTADQAEQEITSGYGQLLLSLGERLSVNAGIRHDGNSQFGGETTGQVAVAIAVPETATVIRGGWGTGFSAPTPFQLGFVCTFCLAFADPAVTPVANTTLAAEESDSWEIGIDQRLFDDAVTLSVTYFNQDIDNLIDFDVADVGFVNIAEADQQGVEVALAAVLHKTLRLDASYTYLDAEDGSGARLALLPEHRAAFELSWTPIDRLMLGAGILYNGDEIDGATGATIDSFTTLALRASYALTGDLDLFLRVENVTDTDYQDIAGFGTQPVSAFAGLRATF